MSNSNERQQHMTSNATGGGLPSETESRVAVEGHIRHGERNYTRTHLNTMGSRMAGADARSRAALHDDAEESIKTVPVAGNQGLMVGRVAF